MSLDTTDDSRTHCCYGNDSGNGPENSWSEAEDSARGLWIRVVFEVRVFFVQLWNQRRRAAPSWAVAGLCAYRRQVFCDPRSLSLRALV
jgi:hypothetical protein